MADAQLSVCFARMGYGTMTSKTGERVAPCAK